MLKKKEKFDNMINPNINLNSENNNPINDLSIMAFLDEVEEPYYENYEDPLALCTIYSKMAKTVNYYYTSGTKTGKYYFIA